MWQALLLSQTQLTQGLGHLSTSPSLALRVAEVLMNFLPPPIFPSDNSTPPKPGLGMSPSGSSPIKRAQASPAVGFTLVRKLWSVVRNVLATSCLSTIAERVLVSILAKRYPLSDDHKFQDAWRALCADLVVACFADAVAFVLRPPPPLNGSEDLKVAPGRWEVWRMIAERWQIAPAGLNWETGVQLLMTARR